MEFNLNLFKAGRDLGLASKLSKCTLLMRSAANSPASLIELLHLWTLFDEAAALRNTISKRGDFSVEHQKLVQAFFDIAVGEVGSDLLENLSEGMPYIKWQDHYMACRLSTANSHGGSGCT